MPTNAPKPEFKSAERLAFEHYLRTGKRPAVAEAPERKFNPYHDPRNGQFTFAPGGPKSLQNPLFSDRRGLWKPKEKPAGASVAEMPTDASEHVHEESSRARSSVSNRANGASSPGETGAPFGEIRTSDLKIYLPVARNASGPFLKISAQDDGAKYANCPVGGNCRETISVTPRNSNDIQLVLNGYRRSILENGWKDNDFENLVDIRYALYTLMEREAIAAHISEWDPTQLAPADWIAENIAGLNRDDPESFTRTFAQYMTLAIDGPGPSPDLLTLENLMNPGLAAQEQAEWLKRQAIHRSYQLLVGPEPIFTITEPVSVDGARAIDRGASYEEEIRKLYGGDAKLRPPEFTTILDGKAVKGQADHITEVGGRLTAVDAKYTDGWMGTIRNPLSVIGVMPWSAKEQDSMITQARRYSSAYEGGVIYHTNSFELARFYTKLFNDSGIDNFKFIVTLSR